MSYVSDHASFSTPKREAETTRRSVPESEWRQYDFGMDCLIPAEDYALPKDHENYRD
ncbi:hypothetical protein [Pseudooceanicola sp.]|uniref:hypothetical protein n=1 Tax=Pseudooceanicola sp. TaxID=1914328 RepID=UPI0035C757FD